MPLPKQFYYNLTQNKQRFVRTSTGNPSINRLIQGKADYWISPSQSNINKPKKLILADWSAQTWCERKIDLIIDKISKLMEEGFEFYIWQRGYLSLLEKNSLQLLQEHRIRINMLPESLANVMLTTCKQLSFIQDEVLVLDDYWIEQMLLNESELRPRHVSMYAFGHLDLKEQTSVLTLLQQAKPALSQIRLDSFTIKEADLELMMEQFPDIPTLQEFEYLQRHHSAENPFSRFDLPDKLENIYSLKLTSLYLKSETFGVFVSQLNVGNIYTLELNGPYTWSERDNLNVPAGRMGGTENILMSDFEINASQLNLLLFAAPKIRRLSLLICNIGHDAFELLARSLPHLETLDLSRSTIHPKTLENLLLAAPNLTTLNLSYTKGLSETLLSSADSLSHLKSLHLSNTDVKHNILENMLVKFNTLQHLDIIDCSDLDQGHINLSPGQLVNLREINTTINMSAGSFLIFDSILRAAPSIKKIKLSLYFDDEPNDGLLSIATESVMNVEEIHIDSSEFQYGDIQTLLYAAHRLKILTITESRISYEGGMLCEDELLALKSLERLVIQQTSFDQHDLREIVQAAPKLKSFLYDDNTPEYDVDDELDLADLWEKYSSTFPRPSTFVSQEDSDNGLTTEETFPPTTIAVHDPKRFLDYEPTPTDVNTFKFRGKEKNINQRMLIEKISQYFTITQQHIECIPRLQDGICKPLAHYFLDNPGPLHGLLQLSLAWNGKIETLTPELISQFDLFYTHYLIPYKLNFVRKPLFFLGNALGAFLENFKPNIVLENPWHSISVHYHQEKQTWEIYDPNCNHGPAEKKILSELLETIEVTIGQCVTVVSPDQTMTPIICDVNTFFNGGGLLSLARCVNQDEIFNTLPPDITLSEEGLEGLFLRDIQGIPAWVSGINHYRGRLVLLTLHLLQQFISSQPDNYKKQLQHSIDLLTTEQKKLLITQINQAASDDLKVKLVELLRTAPNTAQYERLLQPWDNKKACVLSFSDYFLKLSHPTSPRNRLIECSSDQQLEAFRFAIMNHMNLHDRHFFYVHSPDDLVCSAPYIMRRIVDNKGILSRNGGELHWFLTQDQPQPMARFIIVNYANFTTADIVRFNGLLDDKRHSDGIPIPENDLIIGLIDTADPDCYQGSDFYSRFNTREVCPYDAAELASYIPIIPTMEQPLSDSAWNINLFHSLNWEQYLLGYWVLDGDQLTYKEGALQKQLESGATTICIQNGLWENRDFLHFWQKSCQLGAIIYANKIILLPPNFNIVRQEGYSWQRLIACLQSSPSTDIFRRPLNPSNFESFFKQNRVSEPRLLPMIGHIEACQNSTLYVYITRTLDVDDWGRLLTECGQHCVKLNVHCAPGVLIPEELMGILPETPSPMLLEPWKPNSSHTMEVIQSNDIDVTTHFIHQSLGHVLVFDISECSSVDILWRIDGRLDTSSLTFEFRNTQSDMLRALESGANIILKGTFSEELADALTLQVLTEPYKGRLFLISEDTSLFPCLPRWNHQVNLPEKLSYLRLDNTPSYLEPYVNSESVCKLNTRRAYHTLYPDTPTDNAWAGITELTETIDIPQDFDEKTSLSETQEHTRIRLSAVNRILEIQPYVFLAGLSGVGKTTFVTDELATDSEPVYQGKEQIHAWANNTLPSNRKLLFLDEANLGDNQWSLFEGLFQDSPAIFFEGKYYPLTQHHKVIFAGNPHKYGDERILVQFFLRHGNALVFDPLPSAVIYEKILRPIFENTLLEPLAADISRPFLDVYKFLCECSTTDVLISPRELQMMALLVSSYTYFEILPQLKEDSLFAAKYYAYSIGVDLVPKSHLSSFDTLFKPANDLPTFVSSKKEISAPFVITPSRLPIQQQMDDLLRLREYRQSIALEDIQRYGGLGGLVVEGEPGIGKSELISACLHKHGYKQFIDGQPLPENPYYYIPSSQQSSEKRVLLLQAFHQGAIVIIDEINSSPMMEDLLNHLLMGKTPEGKRPTCSGFFVIGTQNPSTMAGRRTPSTALLRRLLTVTLPPYPTEEMIEILVRKQLPADIATALVATLEKQVAHAKKHHLTPAPTFRDVLKLAERIISTHTALFQADPMHTGGAAEVQLPLLPFSIFRKNKEFEDEEQSESKRMKNWDL